MIVMTKDQSAKKPNETNGRKITRKDKIKENFFNIKTKTTKKSSKNHSLRKLPFQSNKSKT